MSYYNLACIEWGNFLCFVLAVVKKILIQKLHLGLNYLVGICLLKKIKAAPTLVNFLLLS